MTSDSSIFLDAIYRDVADGRITDSLDSAVDLVDFLCGRKDWETLEDLFSRMDLERADPVIAIGCLAFALADRKNIPAFDSFRDRTRNFLLTQYAVEKVEGILKPFN